MKFRFKQFEFDCEQLILKQDGKIFELNEKPAQLLLLFLTQADKIRSKHDILDRVWSGRVVSDQVVFQNISHLRALFGNDAIKTYTRKGYQWQLPLTEGDKKPAQESDFRDEAEKAEPRDRLHEYMAQDGKSSKVADWKRLGVYAFIISACVLFVWRGPSLVSDKADTVPSRLLQLSRQVDGQLPSDIRLLPQNNSLHQSLFDSPDQTWRSANLSEGQLLLGLKLYPLKGKMKGHQALRFQLQGKNRGWHGYLSSADIDTLIRQLVQFIETVSKTGYFNLASKHAALAQLVLLLEGQPNNQLITQELIKLHSDLGNFDIAEALVDYTLGSTEGWLNLGLFQLLKANIISLNGEQASAEAVVERSIENFSDLNLPHLESKARVHGAWVAFVNGNGDRSREYLNGAANKARMADEPLQEVQVHLTQAFMAVKGKEPALYHSHLDFAKQLIELHRLDDEHRVAVLSTLAWSANSKEQALEHYQAILSRPFSEQYRYNFYLAADVVRSESVQNNQFQTALDTIRDWQSRSFSDMTRARVAFAKGDWQRAQSLASAAFQSAQITLERNDALDAALLLLQNEEHLSPKFPRSKYIDFIAHKGTKRWLRMNRLAIAKLGYW